LKQIIRNEEEAWMTYMETVEGDKEIERLKNENAKGPLLSKDSASQIFQT